MSSINKIVGGGGVCGNGGNQMRSTPQSDTAKTRDRNGAKNRVSDAAKTRDRNAAKTREAEKASKKTAEETVVETVVEKAVEETVVEKAADGVADGAADEVDKKKNKPITFNKGDIGSFIFHIKNNIVGAVNLLALHDSTVAGNLNRAQLAWNFLNKNPTILKGLKFVKGCAGNTGAPSWRVKIVDGKEVMQWNAKTDARIQMEFEATENVSFDNDQVKVQLGKFGVSQAQITTTHIEEVYMPFRLEISIFLGVNFSEDKMNKVMREAVARLGTSRKGEITSRSSKYGWHVTAVLDEIKYSGANARRFTLDQIDGLREGNSIDFNMALSLTEGYDDDYMVSLWPVMENADLVLASSHLIDFNMVNQCHEGRPIINNPANIIRNDLKDPGNAVKEGQRKGAGRPNTPPGTVSDNSAGKGGQTGPNKFNTNTRKPRGDADGSNVNVPRSGKKAAK